jgi:hypothetical protein
MIPTACRKRLSVGYITFWRGRDTDTHPGSDFDLTGSGGLCQGGGVWSYGRGRAYTVTGSIAGVEMLEDSYLAGCEGEGCRIHSWRLGVAIVA